MKISPSKVSPEENTTSKYKYKLFIYHTSVTFGPIMLTFQQIQFNIVKFTHNNTAV